MVVTRPACTGPGAAWAAASAVSALTGSGTCAMVESTLRGRVPSARAVLFAFAAGSRPVSALAAEDSSISCSLWVLLMSTVQGLPSKVMPDTGTFFTGRKIAL